METQKPGFLRNIRSQPADLVKNPVSLVWMGGRETGFFAKYSIAARRFGQKPGFFGRSGSVAIALLEVVDGEWE
ncbi:hypothetical protein [Microcoleus sp.]|uniref:hypothetical protein n=1 Tax=Microcoleus sp. TaxID=44472 RepID=UPI00352510B8